MACNNSKPYTPKWELFLDENGIKWLKTDGVSTWQVAMASRSNSDKKLPPPLPSRKAFRAAQSDLSYLPRAQKTSFWAPE